MDCDFYLQINATTLVVPKILVRMKLDFYLKLQRVVFPNSRHTIRDEITRGRKLGKLRTRTFYFPSLSVRMVLTFMLALILNWVSKLVVFPMLLLSSTIISTTQAWRHFLPKLKWNYSIVYTLLGILKFTLFSCFAYALNIMWCFLLLLIDLRRMGNCNILNAGFCNKTQTSFTCSI
jgi:hypothetical protein